MLSYNN